MTQYCRYCSNLIVGNGIWCEALQRELSERTAKRANRCRHFYFLNIDAFNENKNGYRPRKKSEIRDNQIAMEILRREEEKCWHE